MKSDELVFRVQGSSAEAATPITLAEAGLRERAHLQEWVLANPTILGDDVIIVTSEFDRWVSKTGREPDRLDILGLDGGGRLVIAELKRDRAPDVVTMQAINYAARASRFQLEELAEAYLSFHSGDDAPQTSDEALAALRTHAPGLSSDTLRDPRIVLVAGDFPPAVTSAVVWLSEHDVDITLVQIRAYRFGDSRAITVSRVWPVPDAEDYVVAPARKDRASAGSPTIPEKEWTVADLRTLGTMGVSQTILVTMDLCAQHPGTWVGGDRVIAVTGRDVNAHRGDYGGFAITLRRRFDRSNPPYAMQYGAGDIYQQYYRLDADLAEVWRGLRGLDV